MWSMVSPTRMNNILFSTAMPLSQRAAFFMSLRNGSLAENTIQRFQQLQHAHFAHFIMPTPFNSLSTSFNTLQQLVRTIFNILQHL